MNVNYDRVCRLCLSSRGELLPIFPTTSSDEAEPHVLATKIKDCVSVQINEDDNLPTNVCRKCMDNVNNWHIFKIVCEKTQNKLQSLIEKDGSLLEEVKIKSEPLSDEIYDDGVVIDASYAEEHSGSAKIQPEGPPILASLGLTPRSDKNYVDPRMDWHRVHAIMKMIQDNNVIDSLQNNEESDILYQSDHDSESEAELDLIDSSHNKCDQGYKCSNNQIIFKYPPKIIEKGTFNKRKGKFPKNCPRPKNAWQLLFTDDLLELIVSSTNENINKGASVETNVNEIKSLIGILYLHGIIRPTHQSADDLWDDEYGVPCVRNSMTIDRFKFLLAHIKFEKEENETFFDPMRRMRTLFEMFAMNCRTAFNIDDTAVVDEVIVPVYGPCPFRYDIDKKPLKRGMKMVMLVDPSNFYVSNLDVVTDPYFKAEDIVRKITQHLNKSGTSIIMDSWYFSNSLMNSLKECGLYTIGALNPKSESIPPIFMSKYRKPHTFMSGFSEDNVSVTSYVNSESKSLNVISSDPKYYRKRHKYGSTAVFDYMKNQSAVEVVDVLSHYYTTMQHTNDWTMSLFFTLLNIASINAQVIWSSVNPNTIQRRLFIRQLAASLIKSEDLLLSTLLNPLECSKKLKLSLSYMPATTQATVRRRCKLCTKMKRERKTNQFCLKCGQFICKEHYSAICLMCLNK